MVVHIVMIKFAEAADKNERIREAKRRIDALIEQVPSLRSMETGINFSEEERAMDLVLTTTFDDRKGLEEYAVHPEHLRVIDYIKSVAEYSKVVDYETV
ncbi:Dabb family protein [Nitratifractor salsuginis]|uniref:Stress responsive alpha-beta barrel domain-containing protein n=1 Tax=Nitratifractor salsuginis (strain DSM 16511 / JCM 12458 / E9I37-1) TaxID=749222 RepID=E6X0L5_NITSE|nr:Dabb family protein [Nitratifractor salsuginis]ADV45735.1 Stress responsive alpha-beta barrel domain-containing protein [Nitratifractor salsuginis DSM 16511]